MWAVPAGELDFADAWQEGDAAARWRSAAAHGPAVGARESGSSVIEVEPGCKLPRHTDSAEEVIVVIAGEAVVEIEGESAVVEAGGMALVRRDAPHEVRNSDHRTLRFVALYASAEVVTRYERPVEPGGERERSPVE